MTGNVKTIKFLIIPTLLFAILTYIVSVHTNINNSYVTSEFLTTIFGGLFTSAMIVLLLEFQKYFFNKHNAEAYTFHYAMQIYMELSLAKGNLQSFIEHKEETVPKQLLSSRLPSLNQSIANIQMIDYTPLINNNALLNKLNCFKRDAIPMLSKYIGEFTYLEIVIIQESMEVDRYNGEMLRQFQNCNNHKIFVATSENEQIRSVLKKLSVEATVQLTVLDNLLQDIELSCKNKYGWKKSKEIIDNQKYDITQQHKITEDYINN